VGAVLLAVGGVEDAASPDDSVLVAVDVAVFIGASGGVDVPEIMGADGPLICTDC
jgi:hypothetical protein